MNNNNQQMQIDISKFPVEYCSHCGSTAFIQVLNLRTINAFQSPTGKPIKVETPIGMLCAECGFKYYQSYNALPKEDIDVPEN